MARREGGRGKIRGVRGESWIGVGMGHNSLKGYEGTALMTFSTC